MSVAEKVKSIIVEQLGVDADEVTNNASALPMPLAKGSDQNAVTLQQHSFGVVESLQRHQGEPMLPE